MHGGAEVQELVRPRRRETGQLATEDDREGVDRRIVQFALPPGADRVGGKGVVALREDVAQSRDRPLALHLQQAVEVAREERSQHGHGVPS